MKTSKSNSFQTNAAGKSLEIVKKAKIRTIIIITVCMILFIAGLVLAIMGVMRMHESDGYVLLFVFATFMIVIGFFGSYVGSLRITSIEKEQKVVRAIVCDGLSSVAEVSMKLYISGGEASDLINKCICKGYLPDYVRIYDTVTINRHIELSPAVHTFVCSHCGATLTLQKGDEMRCPYCGCALTPPRKKK